MSVEQNKATIRRVVEEVFNQKNMSVIPELIAPGYLYRSPRGVDFKGPAGFAQLVGMWHGACPDLNMAIEDMFGEGDRLAARLSMRGTFTGDLGPMKGTGKRFNRPFAVFYRFEGGKELEAVEYGDRLSFYQQMGVMPPGIAQTEEANKASERRFIEEVLNQGNISRLPEFIAPNYVYHLPGNEVKGPEGLVQLFSMYKSAVPDFHYKIEYMVGEGDLLAVFCTLSGTLKGTFMGAPPTNKRMVLPVALLTRWENGKEVEAWPYSDSLSMYKQLGIKIPE